MSTENSRRQRSVSPPESGRQSPAPKPTTRRQIEEEPRKHDKGYRRYASSIDRALASFDAGRLEWPDYISFLGRLLKAIQAHSGGVDVLPHASGIAHRLAQCLNPSLPSGVHQKAIEVYSYIFSLIGRDALARNLTLYLPGISSVLSFASLSLRPNFLSLTETHILTLPGPALRPALKALLLILLPGLEDETSDDFERTLQDLDNLKEAVAQPGKNGVQSGQGTGDEHFWQCLFLATISNNSRRQGALSYLSRRLPRLGPQPHTTSAKLKSGNGTVLAPSISVEAESVVSPEPGLLIRCFVAGLCDEQMLLQRGFLDLLLTHLPLNSLVLTSIAERASVDLLVTAATSVVLRRDMSLNRRLWSWYLGAGNSRDVDEDSAPSSPNEVSNDAQDVNFSTPEIFFDLYGSKALTRSLLGMISQSKSSAVEAAKPFRTCLSLMDRREIGGRLVSHVFLPAMENLLTFKQQSSEEDFQEVLRSANGFFDGVEAGLIWAQLTKLVTEALEPNDLSLQSKIFKIKTAVFIINHFNVREEEMLMVHIPLTLTVLLSLIRSREVQSSSPKLNGTDELWEEAELLAEKLTQLVPEKVHSKGVDSMSSIRLASNLTQEPPVEAVMKIEAFYRAHEGNLEAVRPPLNFHETREILLVHCAILFISALQTGIPAKIVEARSKILGNLIAKAGDVETLDFQELLLAFKTRLSLLEDGAASMPRISFATLSAIVRVLVQLRTQRPEDSNSAHLPGLINTLVELLWDHCAAPSPRHHVEAVRCLWQLDDALPSARIVEASISDLLAQEEDAVDARYTRIESARRFAVLWTHTAQLCTIQSKRNNSIWSKPGSIANDASGFQVSRNYQAQLERPLLLLLDTIGKDDSEMAYFVKNWIQSLSNFQTIVAVLLSRLSVNQALHSKNHATMEGELKTQLRHFDDSLEGLYYLQKLSAILRICTDEMWASLLEETELQQNLSEVDESASFMESVARLCMDTIRVNPSTSSLGFQSVFESMQREGLAVLRLLLMSPNSASLQNLAIEDSLIQCLRDWLKVESGSSSIQIALLDTITIAMKTKDMTSIPKPFDRHHKRNSSVDTMKTSSRMNLNTDSIDVKVDNQGRSAPPSQLVKCLQEGITSSSSHLVLDNWVKFLIDVWPFFENTIFQHLMPLVECFCKQIRYVFQHLMETLKGGEAKSSVPPETALMSLLNGLEYILANAHERLTTDENRNATPRSPEPVQQGFFGNVVSGVFSSEAVKSRNALANTKLTVILCLQDAFRICLSIWSWSRSAQEEDPGDLHVSASFTYISIRLRNKTRRMLDRIFTAEPLESIETLVVAWSRQGGLITPAPSSSLMHVMHILDSSKPKNAMPAVFNAIYSRTNPGALDSSRMSSLTSDLSDVELGQFLNEYTHSLDDDAMDEIWSDCMSFLRDVLTNPQPHHRILPCLLQFLVTLTEKVDNTNFGEQRRMRKELSDIFMRLLAASFSGRTLAVLQESVDNTTLEEKSSKADVLNATNSQPKPQTSDLVDVLNLIVPRLPLVLTDGDRLSSALTTLSTNFTGPIIHAKVFPENIRLSYLQLFSKITKITQAAKVWRKDVTDAFNHAKLFSCDVELVLDGWAPILRQWSLVDKDRVTEVCSRIAAPTSAGIMFGVGASAARLEADKKTQMNLRRIALLILANEDDFIVGNLKTLEEKIIELQGATPASSPSSATRAEVFMVWQAVVLKTSSVHLASIWSTVTAELQKAIASSLPRNQEYDTYNTSSLLQACWLLDLLLLVGPDEFQLREWLFITDTIEAVYRPGNWEPVALVDEIAEEMGSTGMPALSPQASAVQGDPLPSTKGLQLTSPLLQVNEGELAQMSKDNLISKILRPYFTQLSINAYETTYSMRGPDLKGCKEKLLRDLFDDTTIVG